MKTVIERREEKLWLDLVLFDRHDIIELLYRADRGEIKKVQINRQLTSNTITHLNILSYLKRRGVEVIGA